MVSVAEKAQGTNATAEGSSQAANIQGSFKSAYS